MARRQAPAEWSHYRAAADRGIELLHAHYSRHVYERHSHDTYAVGVTEAGVQAFSCRGASHASAAGMIMAFNPAEPHDGHAPTPEGFTYRMLYIEPALVARVVEDACGRDRGLPFFTAPVLRDRPLARLIAAAHESFASPAGALERDAALGDMILRLATRHGDAVHGLPAMPDDHGALRRVRDYLHAAYAEDVSADELAGIAGLSRFHLSRAFRRVYGLAPHAYLLHLRLAEAKRRLACGEAPAEVAAAAGFADQSHLTKRFKGSFGITPGQFARACAVASA